MGRMSTRTAMFRMMSVLRRGLAATGRSWQPRPLVDAVIRTSRGGDLFGLRRAGLSFAKLVDEHPHGVVVDQYVPTGVLRKVVVYRRGRIRLQHDDISSEISAVQRRSSPQEFPMRLIGMRQPRSENSWMHNSPILMDPVLKRGEPVNSAVMHTMDAAELGVGDGDVVQIRSAQGSVEIAVTVSADIMRGTVAVPHGWGHRGTGQWRLANRAGGVNVNELMSSEPADIEALAGMAWLTGIPVRVQPA